MIFSLAYHEHSDPKSLTFKCDLEGYPTLWRMPADEWDDSAILKAFELALKGEDNRSVKTKNEEKSEFEKADKRFQSLLKKGHESGPGLWKSTTEGAADYPGVSRTGPTPPPSSSVPPIGGGGAFPPDFLGNSLQSVQGGALQDMLLAWYYSGYYTGRYQAIQEMQNGQTPEDADQ